MESRFLRHLIVYVTVGAFLIGLLSLFGIDITWFVIFAIGFIIFLLIGYLYASLGDMNITLSNIQTLLEKIEKHLSDNREE